MSAHVGRRDPHTTVERELLVRYLDAWTPAVLRSHRGATYVESGDAVTDALRVFGEFADMLAGHRLEVVLLGAAVDPAGDVPPGLSVRSVADPADVTAHGAMLAHLDVVTGALAEPDAWRLVAALARGKAFEVLLTLPAAGQAAECRGRLRTAGLAYAVSVELTDDDGRAELIMFATGDSKHLATFKNEMWAADEFAGIRYRDPHDTESTPIDISLNPQLLPLRRALLAEVARRGRCTVAELQRHTLLETIYRPADAIGVLTSAASAGAISREPAKGRLSPRTVVVSR